MTLAFGKLLHSGFYDIISHRNERTRGDIMSHEQIKNITYLTKIDTGTITSEDVEQGFDELENNNTQTIEEWLETKNLEIQYIGILAIIFLIIILICIRKKK